MADDEKQKEIVQKEDYVGDITFFPPLYQQRYCLVVEFLEKRGVTSVVDFGCAECKLVPMVRRIPCIEEMVGVDIDRELLKTRNYILKPLLGDYLSPREKPLRIRLFEGSISKFDSRLDDIHAVTMVEVIEHLTPDVLADFPAALFGRLQPEYILITTPNEEFNVLFTNFSGMRHDDHKFEWTRQEFQEWCHGVCSRYSYDVEYGGVGKPPKDRQDVMELEFPYRERLGEDAAILLEATYQMRQIVVRRQYPDGDGHDYHDYNVEDERDGHWIPLDDILRYHRVQNLCTDANQLRTILKEADYVVSEDGTEVFMKDEYEEDDGDLWGVDDDEEEQQDEERAAQPCSSGSEEETWSDGEDERCQQASQVIPYSVMWEDAEEDQKGSSGHRLVGTAAAPPPQGPSVLDTDPEMVYLPAVLHAASQPRLNRDALSIEGQFDDNDTDSSVAPTEWCSPPRRGVDGDTAVGGHTGKVKLVIPIEDGQFDDVDTDDDTQPNTHTGDDTPTKLQNGQTTVNSTCTELESLTLKGS